MEEQVLYALQEQNWNPEAARQWLMNHLGDVTPGLVQFQQQCAVAAKSRWREILQQYGIDLVAANEAEARLQAGPLAAHLNDNDASNVNCSNTGIGPQIRNHSLYWGRCKVDE